MNTKLFYLLALIGLISLACSATAPAALAAPPTQRPPTATQTTAASPPTWAPTPAGVACVVAADALNVRSCAGVACPVQGWLMIGQRVFIAGDITTGWALLSTGGYVNSDYLTCKIGE